MSKKIDPETELRWMALQARYRAHYLCGKYCTERRCLPACKKLFDSIRKCENRLRKALTK